MVRWSLYLSVKIPASKRSRTAFSPACSWPALRASLSRGIPRIQATLVGRQPGTWADSLPSENRPKGTWGPRAHVEGHEDEGNHHPADRQAQQAAGHAVYDLQEADLDGGHEAIDHRSARRTCRRRTPSQIATKSERKMQLGKVLASIPAIGSQKLVAAKADSKTLISRRATPHPRRKRNPAQAARIKSKES